MMRLVLLMSVLLFLGAAEETPPVLNQWLSVAWWQGQTAGWYRRETPSGHEYVVIDAVSGTRRLAFDHAQMARSLTKVLGKEISATNLPIGHFRIHEEDQVIEVLSHTFLWEGRLPDMELTQSTRWSGDILMASAYRSERTGPSVHLEVVNRLAQDVGLYWVDFQGHRQAYGWVKSGEARRQQTHVGHVWLVVERDGQVLDQVEIGAGGERVEVTGVKVSLPPVPADPNESPNGEVVVLARDDNLWLRTHATGKEYALTSDGSAEDRYLLPISWSPDGAYVAARRLRPGQQRTITLTESSPAGQVQPRSRTIRYDKPGDRINEVRPCLIRIPDRTLIPLDVTLVANPWSIDELSWNKDGTAFSVLFNQRGHQVMRLVEFDRRGAARLVFEESSRTFIDYAGKAHFQRLGDGGFLWMSERDGWNHLYRVDATTGQVRNQITTGEWAVRSVERIDEQAGLIWFTAGGMVPGEDPYHVHHCRVAFDGSALTRLTDGDGTHTVQWSPDRRWFIDTWSRVDLPPQHVLRDGRTGKLVIDLETADISALRATGWQQPERFVAKGRDGITDIHGVLWRPKDFDPAKRYPVVEEIYAGPHAAHVPKAFRAGCRQQDIADLGFIVGMVDGMGTSQRSKAFHDVCWKNLADAGFPDRIPWWKAAAATRPWMDLSRVGIYGGSAGGQSAMGALLSHPEFYHVAVADCGCHDNRMDKIWWNELWMGWPVGPHYAEQSNVTNAHKLQGKLMLIVGEIDDNVDPQSTHQVAQALEKAGKDFELVVVHGQGHGAAETAFGKQKRAGFLVRHLLGREP